MLIHAYVKLIASRLADNYRTISSRRATTDLKFRAESVNRRSRRTHISRNGLWYAASLADSRSRSRWVFSVSFFDRPWDTVG